MRKLLLTAVLVFGFSVDGLADPVPLDNTVPPCDSNSNTGKPPCNADSGSVKVPTPLPNEKGGVIVPPEIPAGGLPSQKNKTDPGLPAPVDPPRP